MKADQERVKQMLAETILLLCKNGLYFQKRMTVQGLLGITLDDTEIFMIHLNEVISPEVLAECSGPDPDSFSEVQSTNGCGKNSCSIVSDSGNVTNQVENFSTIPQLLDANCDNEFVQDEVSACVKLEPKEDDTDIYEQTESLICLDDHLPAFPGEVSTSSQSFNNRDLAESKAYVFAACESQTSDQTNRSNSFLMGHDALTNLPYHCDQEPELRKAMDFQNNTRPNILRHKVQHQVRAETSDEGNCRFFPGSSQYSASDLCASRYRSKYASDKEYHCTYPDCSLSFFARRTLLRHQTQKHGRPKNVRYGGRTYNVSNLYSGHSFSAA